MSFTAAQSNEARSLLAQAGGTGQTPARGLARVFPKWWVLLPVPLLVPGATVS